MGECERQVGERDKSVRGELIVHGPVVVSLVVLVYRSSCQVDG